MHPPGPPYSFNAFFDAYAEVEGRWELVDGLPVQSPPRTIWHASIIGNLLVASRVIPEGPRCLVLGSQFAVQTGLATVRYPDLGVFCDRRDLDCDPNTLRAGRFPKVIADVISPATHTPLDAKRVAEFLAIETLELLLVIDIDREVITFHERDAGGGWQMRTVERPASIYLAPIDIHLSWDEVMKS